MDFTPVCTTKIGRLLALKYADAVQPARGDGLPRGRALRVDPIKPHTGESVFLMGILLSAFIRVLSNIKCALHLTAYNDVAH